MQEHHREERQEIRVSEISVAAAVSRRDEREARYQRVSLHRRQADLNQEYRAIDCDQPQVARGGYRDGAVFWTGNILSRAPLTCRRMTVLGCAERHRFFVARRQIRLPAPSNHDDHQVLY
jgi:hypothetical protein